MNKLYNFGSKVIQRFSEKKERKQKTVIWNCSFYAIKIKFSEEPI